MNTQLDPRSLDIGEEEEVIELVPLQAPVTEPVVVPVPELEPV